MNLEQALAEIERLNALVHDYETDRAYRCYTRPGIERRHSERSAVHDGVIFLDLDRMHECNERFGYAGVDKRIAAALSTLTVLSGVHVGRWYSGDELVILCPLADAVGLAHRLHDAFCENDMSATFGVAPLGDDLEEAVHVASDLVQSAKFFDRRGSITLAA